MRQWFKVQWESHILRCLARLIFLNCVMSKVQSFFTFKYKNSGNQLIQNVVSQVTQRSGPVYSWHGSHSSCPLMCLKRFGSVQFLVHGDRLTTQMCEKIQEERVLSCAAVFIRMGWSRFSDTTRSRSSSGSRCYTESDIAVTEDWCFRLVRSNSQRYSIVLTFSVYSFTLTFYIVLFFNFS